MSLFFGGKHCQTFKYVSKLGIPLKSSKIYRFYEKQRGFQGENPDFEKFSEAKNSLGRVSSEQFTLW